MHVLLAVTIVVAVKVVGIVLIAAFLVIPAATGRLLAGSFRAMTLWGMGIGAVSAVLGLHLSYGLDLPSGATIVLVQAAGFVLGMGLRRVVGVEG